MALDSAIAPNPALRVALIGSHEKGYPRNELTLAALERAGFEVTVCHSVAPFPWRHLVLAIAYFKIHRRIDILVVTEGGHRLVPLLRLWALMTGKKVVFDPFLSRYNTRVEERRLHAPNSLQAWICKWQDWSSTHAADALIFDTRQNRDYFYSRYNLRKPFAVIPVGVDERLFYPRPKPGDTGSASVPKTIRVFFIGTYIPLHGVEHILEAARILQARDAGENSPEVTFHLSGRGQTYPAMRALADSYGLHNVVFEEPLKRAEVADRIRNADICLGIFGVSEKGFNAVPNKCVQAAATGAAMLTADTPAMRRYFKEGESIAFVPAGDGAAIATRILELGADPGRLTALGQGAREVFLRHFALARLAEDLGRFLRDVRESRLVNR